MTLHGFPFLNVREKTMRNTEVSVLSQSNIHNHICEKEKCYSDQKYEAFIRCSIRYVQTVIAHSRACNIVCGGHEKATTLWMGTWVSKRGPVVYNINGVCQKR